MTVVPFHRGRRKKLTCGRWNRHSHRRRPLSI